MTGKSSSLYCLDTEENFWALKKPRSAKIIINGSLGISASVVDLFAAGRSMPETRQGTASNQASMVICSPGPQGANLCNVAPGVGNIPRRRPGLSVPVIESIDSSSSFNARE